MNCSSTGIRGRADRLAGVAAFLLPLAAALCLMLPADAARARGDSSVRRSVVKIHVQKTVPSFKQPWVVNGPSESSGSGCIISGRHILTSAHVVSHAAFIHVSKFGDPKKYTADLLFISHHADLAILTVKEKEFFDDVKPFEISRDLVHTQEEVTVYGFPVGGETLSATRGIVSRVEHEIYSHNVNQLLIAQIDAPINPGNSGGPAVVDGRIVGVVIQALVRSESIGYMVPTPVIDHFLDDIKDGSYDGFPVLGVQTQEAQNPDLRESKGVEEEDVGVLVNRIAAGSPAYGVIDEGDILLSIDGTDILPDGTVNFRGNERTNFSHLIDSRQIGDTVAVEVLREGRKMKMDVVLSKGVDDVRLINANYGSPSYYIFAGCVFSPLTLNYMRSWGRRWFTEAPVSLLSKLSDIRRFPDEEVVFLVRVLPSEVNYGYHGMRNWLVESVNGVKIRNIRHLVKVVEKEAEKGGFITFKNPDGEQIVISADKAKKSGGPLLSTYRIDEDRSADLVVPIFESMGL